MHVHGRPYELDFARFLRKCAHLVLRTGQRRVECVVESVCVRSALLADAPFVLGVVTGSLQQQLRKLQQCCQQQRCQQQHRSLRQHNLDAAVAFVRSAHADRHRAGLCVIGSVCQRRGARSLAELRKNRTYEAVLTIHVRCPCLGRARKPRKP